MTIEELMEQLQEALEDGASPETEVLWVGQENWPLVSEIKQVLPVFPLMERDEDDEDADSDEVEIDYSTWSHLLIVEAGQRTGWGPSSTGESPYTTAAEDAALGQIGWGRH